jgi:hypothetical protein
MDLYRIMEYLTTASGCAAALTVLAPFADRSPRARPGSIADPHTFAKVCALLALLCGLPAFAIGVRLFGLAQVMTTLRFTVPVALVGSAIAMGPMFLLWHGNAQEKRRQNLRRAVDELASQATAVYPYEAGGYRGHFLPFALLVGGGSLYYASLLWSHVKRLGPEGHGAAKFITSALALLLVLVFCACCLIAYRVLFRLHTLLNGNGFFVTESALIERDGLGSDHCIPWDAIHSIQPPGEPSGRTRFGT